MPLYSLHNSLLSPYLACVDHPVPLLCRCGTASKLLPISHITLLLFVYYFVLYCMFLRLIFKHI